MKPSRPIVSVLLLFFPSRMSTHKETSSHNGVWFGVAMLLIGLIAGAILTFAASGQGLGKGKDVIPNIPQEGIGQQAPAPQKADVGTRMLAYANAAGVDEAAFTTCVASKKYEGKVNEQMAQGQAAGVNGTPGNIIYDIKSKKGILVSGAQPIASFQKVIDAMLQDSASAMAQPGVELAKVVTPIDPATDHIRGNPKASIAVIEYSDFECPFCHSVHPTYQKLLEQNNGNVMWVYRHFPLTFHAEAMPLAVGAECMNELGGAEAFWKFTDAVMGE